MRSMAVCEESSPFEDTQVTYHHYHRHHYHHHYLHSQIALNLLCSQASPDSTTPSSCNVNETTSCKEEEQERSTDPKKHSLSKGVCVCVIDI